MKNKQLIFALMVASTFTYSQEWEASLGSGFVKTKGSGNDVSLNTPGANSNEFNKVNEAGEKMVGATGSHFMQTIGVKARDIDTPVGTLNGEANLKLSENHTSGDYYANLQPGGDDNQFITTLNVKHSKTKSHTNNFNQRAVFEGQNVGTSGDLVNYGAVHQFNGHGAAGGLLTQRQLSIAVGAGMHFEFDDNNELYASVTFEGNKYTFKAEAGKTEGEYEFLDASGNAVFAMNTNGQTELPDSFDLDPSGNDPGYGEKSTHIDKYVSGGDSHEYSKTAISPGVDLRGSFGTDNLRIDVHVYGSLRNQGGEVAVGYKFPEGDTFGGWKISAYAHFNRSSMGALENEVFFDDADQVKDVIDVNANTSNRGAGVRLSKSFGGQ